MHLKTAIKVLVALENAPKVKKILMERKGACYRHRGWCTCKPDELCNVALSEYLKMRQDVAWREWNFLMDDLKAIHAVGTRLSTEFLKGKLPPYRPHRFIRLRKSTDDILKELEDVAIREMETEENLE